MPTPKKIATVKNLKENFSSALSVAFVDYQGLSNLQLETLRNQIQEKGGNLQVAKNTLLALALEQSPKKRSELLTGPTAVVFAYTDAAAPLKELDSFIKEYELPTIKGGMLQGEFIPPEKLVELASLPTREELLARVAGQMQAPLVGLRYVLEANLRRLVNVLGQIKGGVN